MVLRKTGFGMYRADRAVALFCALAVGVPVLAAQTASNPMKRQTSSPRAMTTTDPPAEGQQTFPTADQAVHALVSAVKDHDADALRHVLGPDADKTLSSGDATEDQQHRQQFLDKYAQMHRMLTDQSGLTTLYIGAENWPTPIPLARQGKSWYFDTPAGAREILYRRIGQNELTVIQICGEMVDAEKEYYTGAHEYAGRFISNSGQHDGLYWPAQTGQPESPLGPFIAHASEEGYAAGTSPYRTPFYGYFFRVLKAQGPGAPGGAKNYVANGKMTGGFAFIAYPAEYRSSGVMTFVVGSDGVVYQKDLGRTTAQLARAMREFQVDSTWRPAE